MNDILKGVTTKDYQDRLRRVQSVECPKPTCLAEVGHACRSLSGHHCYTHGERWDAYYQKKEGAKR